ncbi:MAG: hypothetical protein DLM58_15455 [Pseudonocardiales bacterium]|nr:MAG: hypothetical protein DLM58_15455 [Pseudonocardiales bacterium]
MRNPLIRPIVLTLALALVAALEVVAPSAASAATINVSHGQSIQAAIDSASPGDTIVVAPGTYRENIQINKNDITLQGAGSTDGTQTILTPPSASKATHNSCFVSGSNFDGICITNGNPPSGPVTAATALSGDTVSGFLVRGFPGIGIHAYGAFNVTMDSNRLTNNALDGVAAYAGGGVAITNSQASGSSEAGFLEADTIGFFTPTPVPVPNLATIANNTATNNGAGIEIRDSTDPSTFFDPGNTLANQTIIDNHVEANCVGILVLDTPNPLQSGESVFGNTVIANNKTCTSLPFVPATVSGTGILVLGAFATVRNNTIRDNVPSDIHLPYAGGFVLASYPGGPVITDSSAAYNTAYGNKPFDIDYQRGGPGRAFTLNTNPRGIGTGIIYSFNNCDTSHPKLIIIPNLGNALLPLCRPTAASQSPGFPGYGPGF